MSGASMEATLDLRASSSREVKGRMRPLFTQARVAQSADGSVKNLGQPTCPPLADQPG